PIVESTAEVFFVQEVQPNVGNPEGGGPVTIQGEGFVPPLRVSFGSALARVLEVTSSRTILVETPPSVTPVNPGGSLLVDVAVTNTLDVLNPPTAVLPGAFTYAFDAPPPFFLLEVVPNVGGPDGGETVTVRGGGFRGQVRVEFGGKNGRNASRVSDQEIRVIVPSPPSAVPAGGNLPVDVVVFHALDEETPGQATLAGGYTYVGGSVPDPPGSVIVESLSVTSGDYQGGTSVTVTGQGFEAPASVLLGGIQQSSVTVASATSLTFVTAGITLDTCPASGQVPQTGVTVTNLDTGASGAALGLTFTYLVTKPRIDTVSRTTGRQVGGESVTLSGGGFESPVRVLLVGASESFAGSVTSDSPTSITFTTPRLPDTFFPTVSCVTNTGAAGQRLSEATVGIEVINLGSDCSDVLANVFTVLPATEGCMATAPTPPRPQCNDGIDNDGDGLIDFSGVSPPTGDPECESLEDNDESQ
ncbi:MAG: IPT/TIG domain-containing protein, partial [Acidobacteria bacterium]|nr:IPT/TIG domain-containing protein [Acidobacteriota bacterium]